MRILVSSPTFLPAVGGAELGIHEIYDRIGRNHEVVVLAPKPGDMDPGVEFDHSSSNYRVERLLPELDHAPSVLRRGARRVPTAYFIEMARLTNRWKPDVLNPHFVERQAAAAAFTGRRLGIPVALSLVGRTDVVHRLDPWHRWRARVAISKADLVFANSGYYLEGEATPSNLEVIPYGVDVSAYRPAARSDVIREDLGIEPGQVAILCVQRLTSVKRVDVLLHVLARALRAEPSLVLVVVGKGEEAERLERLAADLRIEHAVRFVGYVSEESLPLIYASADLFAFHSLHETFGVVFAQAMASGIPVIAAATSCIPLVVAPENGALVAPFDVHGFAAEVVRLAGDAAERAEVGVRNRSRAEREFDWDGIADAYETSLVGLARRA